MRRVVALTAGVWMAVAVLAAQSPGGPASRIPPHDQPGGTASRQYSQVGRDPRSGPGSASGSGEADTAKYRTWVNQYCVTCHSGRSPQPANDPLNLEAASLDDPLKSAATWERVLRKLSVRAMPPAGVPRPEEREYAAFTSWLADSLDRAWAGRSTPGVYVIHRLNRAEYRNAIRDLLALDVDVATMLPNDGGDFGFDNIATALRTSPLLLDGYVTAAQRISTLAIGDAKAVAATAEYSINRNVSQNVRVDGLPLGTRGGTVVRHIFPADGEYKLFGRLVRGIEEGYAGVENDQPDTFVITIDGVEVFSSQIGGPEDHAAQATLQRHVEHVDHGHYDERAEHVRVLERAARPIVDREHLAAAGPDIEVADHCSAGGDQGGDRPGLEDQLGVGTRGFRYERRQHESCGIEIECDGDVDHRRLGIEGERCGEHSRATGNEPHRTECQQRPIESDEADGGKQHDEADGESIDGSRLGEHDAARRDGQRDCGEREPRDEATLARPLRADGAKVLRSCGDGSHKTRSRARRSVGVLGLQ